MLTKSVKDLTAFIAGDKTKLIEVLHPDNDEVNIAYSLAHASLEIGEASLPHVLEACSELYYILKGKGRMIIGEESKILEAGDIAFVPKGLVQYIENQGDMKLEFLCIVSPPWFSEQDRLL